MPDEPGVATGGELWAWIADGASTSYGRLCFPPYTPIVLTYKVPESTNDGKDCVTLWQDCSARLSV